MRAVAGTKEKIRQKEREMALARQDKRRAQGWQKEGNEVRRQSRNYFDDWSYDYAGPDRDRRRTQAAATRLWTRQRRRSLSGYEQLSFNSQESGGEERGNVCVFFSDFSVSA